MNLNRFAFVLLLVSSSTALLGDELTRDEVKFFESKIRPVLIRECFGCHSNKSGNVRGGLRLDNKELMHIGGGSGPAVVPGNLEESWLYNAITHQDFVMPPKRKLPQNVIDDFRKWIEMGAPDPRTSAVAKINSSINKEDIQQAKQSFWAYQTPVKKKLPKVQNDSWPKTDIDYFILAKLEQAKMSAADDAEPGKVLRRLNFDLVGLPPTPKEIEAFNQQWKDDPDRAIAAVVDRLLDKKQFGERWGRHWLDVVRYAESTGREVNMTYPQAWRYRDYVVDAFNEDKSFKSFVQAQIAGDLLPVQTDQEWTKNLVATTFLAIGPKNLNEQNPVQFAADVVDEQIDATTRVFLGMSVACARCHDHKFDAIPQTDYYALAGIFKNTQTYFGHPQSEYGQFRGPQAKQTSTLLVLPIEDPNPFDKRYSSQEIASLKKEITDKLQEMGSLRRNRGTDGNAANSQRQRIRLVNELQKLSGKLGAIDEQGNPKSFCMGVQDRQYPTDAKLLVRGEIDKQAQTVKRGFPQVLSSAPAQIDRNDSGRLQLARWIGSDDNPLTARVMVNRIWQHMIGQGIVTSTENFGVTGQTPSHPDLLDYLAVRFVESGWSVKTIVREIAISRAYRIESAYNKQDHESDPDNKLLWRANPRRLDAEALRDAMLSISGEIDFDRPRASEVAIAGYTRVQEGRLGSPREMLARRRPQFGQSQSQGGGPQSGRPQFGQGQSNRGQSNRGQSGRPQFGQGQSRRPQFGQGQSGRPQFGQGQAGRSRFGQGRFGQGRSGQGQSGQGQSGRPFFGGTPFGSGIARRLGMSGRSSFGFGGIPSNPLDMEEAKFRSVYLPIVRDAEPRSLEVFDFADSSAIIGKRESSNTANQALYMLNNRFVIQQSQAFAKRVAEIDSDPREQIKAAFLLAYGRLPTSGEREATGAFLREFAPTTNYRDRVPATMAALCQSLFASAEFRYID